MNPFDYSLCNQTVTVYRKGERQVVNGVCLQTKVSTPQKSYGKSLEKTFRLIIPGDFPLQPGDRIYDGIGPVEMDWQVFVPALVPQLYECGFAKPCCWDGQVTHWEAGNRKEKL